MKKDESTHEDSRTHFCSANQASIKSLQESDQKDEGGLLYKKENLRNLNCRHYEACLNTAARSNVGDLSCGDCLFKTDNTYQMTEGDLHGLLRLYRAIKA